MKLQYWIIGGVVVLAVLWFLSRMQAPEPQVVPEFITTQSNSGASSESEAIQAQTRLGLVQTLVSYAVEMRDRLLQERALGAQLEATRLDEETERHLAGLIAETERYQSELEAYAFQAETTLRGRAIDAETSLFLEDIRNRAAQARQQLNAIISGGAVFRNQSLERQGTFYNAILGQPYSYTQSFGGSRASTAWYMPIAQGAGRLLGGLRIPGLGG